MGAMERAVLTFVGLNADLLCGGNVGDGVGMSATSASITPFVGCNVGDEVCKLLKMSTSRFSSMFSSQTNRLSDRSLYFSSLIPSCLFHHLRMF